MTPYFADDAITLYHADCREGLADLPSSIEVACTIADPPYGETALQWDRWQYGWVAAVAAATPITAPLWCFGSWRMFWNHPDEFVGWDHAQELVWEKHNGSSSAADRFRRVHEYVVQFYRGAWADVYRSPVVTNDATARAVRRKQRPAQWGAIGEHSYRTEDGGPRLMRSVLKVRSEHGRAVHPTQKPLGILIPPIEYSTPPAATVLDPFVGSGSTLLAAKQLGRRAVGFEADERYCEIAARRLSQGVLSLEASP